MRKIKIVADSSCDLFTLERADFVGAPMKIITDEREFIDTASLNVDEMVEYLYQYKGKSKSSCPNTGDWLDAFGDAEEVFCVTITSGLSGSYNSASAAKQIYESENPGRRVHVFDTLSAGPEVTMTVKRIEECVAEDMSFEDICSTVQTYMDKAGLIFMLKSLKNFANNGRVSPVVAKLVGIMGICIVGKASKEGTLEPMHKCRGEARSLETLVEELKNEGFMGGRISIGHCQNEEAAMRLKSMIEEKLEGAEIEVHRLQGLCSFYAERGGLLVGFERA